MLAIARKVCEKTSNLLEDLGQSFHIEPNDADLLAQESPLLAACYAASLQGSVAIGQRAGQRVLRIGENDGELESDHNKDKTHVHGFNLHAGTRVSGFDKKGRERLLRYILRPSIATNRLAFSKDGQVIYRLKEPRQNGTKCFVFEPLDFIAKLVPLVPAPRVNLIRYHGCFAPHAAIREKVVPEHWPGFNKQEQYGLGFEQENSVSQDKNGHYRCGVKAEDRAPPKRLNWSQLAQRSFKVDILRCAQCGFSPIRVVEIVVAPTREQLDIALGKQSISSAAPQPIQPRAPPAPATDQLELQFVKRAA